MGITGPRQSGKTTIAKLLFPHLPYVSLENLDIRTQAKLDPRGFLQQYLDGAIFDEIQECPELLSYLQQIVDETTKTGIFIITGSQNFALQEHISQSLAGRIGMATLLPLSLNELENPDTPMFSIVHGGYPRLYKMNMSPLEFYPSYIQTYIERDVRQLQQIENLAKFTTFLKLCAGRIGQLLNLSSLAQDAGISHTTAKQWLTVLEASYVTFTLQPYHTNVNKRLVKTPKLYFYDTGLAAALLGIETEEQLKTHYLKGGLFENLIIVELVKERFNKGLAPHLYFWRDKTGHEIDALGLWAGKLHCFEIKLGQTFQTNYLDNLNYFKTLHHDNPTTPEISTGLIYTGHQSGMFKDHLLIPFIMISKMIF